MSVTCEVRLSTRMRYMVVASHATVLPILKNTDVSYFEAHCAACLLLDLSPVVALPCLL